MTKEELEKEAEEWVKTKGTAAMTCLEENIGWDDVCEQAFKDGVEFGYNKANEWHYVKDGDLPKCNNTDLLLYIESKKFKNNFYSLFYRSEQPPKEEQMKRFMITCNVIAWKGIVLPELPKESGK